MLSTSWYGKNVARCASRLLSLISATVGIRVAELMSRVAADKTKGDVRLSGRGAALARLLRWRSRRGSDTAPRRAPPDTQDRPTPSSAPRATSW